MESGSLEKMLYEHLRQNEPVYARMCEQSLPCVCLVSWSVAACCDTGSIVYEVRQYNSNMYDLHRLHRP